MASAVCNVLNLPEAQWRAMSQASYEISKRFDWDQSAEILENTLVNALSGPDLKNQYRQVQTT
jgi:hypothetical protein